MIRRSRASHSSPAGVPLPRNCRIVVQALPDINLRKLYIHAPYLGFTLYKRLHADWTCQHWPHQTNTSHCVRNGTVKSWLYQQWHFDVVFTFVLYIVNNRYLNLRLLRVSRSLIFPSVVLVCLLRQRLFVHAVPIARECLWYWREHDQGVEVLPCYRVAAK